MARAKKNLAPERQARLLEDILIVLLSMAGVAQRQIRDIVGCEMGRVSAIARHVKLPGRKGRGQGGGRKSDKTNAA